MLKRRSICTQVHRCFSRVLLVLLLPTLLTVGAGLVLARQGDARANLFLGTSTFAVDDYRTFGTTFGGSYGYEFQDNLLWTAGAAFTSSEGDALVTDTMGMTQTVDLRASTAQFSTGLLAFFGSRENVLLPFAGGGLSVLNYDLEFPNTTIGNTSGSGLGAYAQVGVEIRLTRNTTFITAFGSQVHSIKTETGSTTGMVSGGLQFSLRIST